MFPGQNVHYIRHYNVGYVPGNFQPNTEYRYKYSPSSLEQQKSPYQPEKAHDPFPDRYVSSYEYRNNAAKNRGESLPPPPLPEPAAIAHDPANYSPYYADRAAPAQEQRTVPYVPRSKLVQMAEQAAYNNQPPTAGETEEAKVQSQQPEAKENAPPEAKFEPNVQVQGPPKVEEEAAQTSDPLPAEASKEDIDRPPQPEPVPVPAAPDEKETKCEDEIRPPEPEYEPEPKPEKDDWAAVMKRQTAANAQRSKQEEDERRARKQQYKAALDLQLQFKSERATYEKQVRARAKELAAVRNSELEKLDRERAERERQMKEMTRQEYDRELEERKALYGGRRGLNLTVDAASPPKESPSPDAPPFPFYFQDMNRQRFQRVRILLRSI